MGSKTYRSCVSRFWQALMICGVSSVCLFGVASTAAAQITNLQFVQNLFYVAPLDAQEQIPGASQQIGQTAIDSANEIAKFVGFGVSSAPLGTSSAGFSYARDPVTGELSLKSRSFGPLFADRPLTNGRGVFSVGFNYQHSRTEYNQDFDTADGREDGIPIFDNRVTFLTDGLKQFVTRRAFLESTVDAVNVFASVGVSDRVDIGVTIPILSVKLDGHQDEMYDITRTFSANTERGRFEHAYRGTPTGILQTPVAGNPSTSQSASGIGDIVVRSKFALTSQRGGQGAAVGVDLSLPTGDEEELLGRGELTARVQLLGSKAISDRASVYGNGGYRFGTDNNEAQYSAGVDVALLPRDRLTVAVSFLGRSLRDAAGLNRYATVRRVSENLGRTEQGAPNPEQSDVIIDRFVWAPATVNLNQVSAEFKLHVGGQLLATGAVLFPINETGLQPRPTPFFGLEWAGGR